MTANDRPSPDAGNGNSNGGLPPLAPPLPTPPTCHIGGVPCVLERVRIDQIEAWRREHGLRFVRRAWFGRPGYRENGKGKMAWAGYGTVSLCWPEAAVEIQQERRG